MRQLPYTYAPKLETIPLPFRDPRDSTFLARAVSSASHAYASPSSSSSFHRVYRYDSRQWSAPEGSGNAGPSVPMASSPRSSSSSSSSSASSSRSGSSQSRLPPSMYDYPPSTSTPYAYAPPTHYARLPQIYTDSYSLPSPSSSISSSTSFDQSGATRQLVLHPGLSTSLVYDLRRPPSTARFLPAPAAESLRLDTHSRFSTSATATATGSSSSHSHLSRPSLPLSSLLDFPYDTPATYPRTSTLSLSLGPHHAIPVCASHPSIGVTCGDLLDTLYDFMQRPLSETELDMLDVERVRVRETYRRRRSRERQEGAKGRSADGGEGEGMKGLDVLMGKTEVLRVVLSSGGGRRCVVETRRPLEE